MNKTFEINFINEWAYFGSTFWSFSPFSISLFDGLFSTLTVDVIIMGFGVSVSYTNKKTKKLLKKHYSQRLSTKKTSKKNVGV